MNKQVDKQIHANELKLRILKLLEEKPIRVKEIIKKVNMSESGVHKILKELHNHGEIIKTNYGIYAKND